MERHEVHAYLRQLVTEGKNGDEIRALIEPHLAPGCKLSTYTDTCITDSGVSGYKQCHEITGCEDPGNNGGKICGDCQGS